MLRRNPKRLAKVVHRILILVQVHVMVVRSVIVVKVKDEKLLFISQDKEMALIQEMSYKIKMSDWDICPSKTCFLCVSPDYSGIVTQHLSHSLSMGREIFHVEAVNVPFLMNHPISTRLILR
jgi:hypothetical protein